MIKDILRNTKKYLKVCHHGANLKNIKNNKYYHIMFNDFKVHIMIV